MKVYRDILAHLFLSAAIKIGSRDFAVWLVRTARERTIPEEHGPGEPEQPNGGSDV